MTENSTLDPVPKRRRRLVMFGNRLLDILVVSLAAILILLFFWPRVVVFVHSGEAGVVWRTYAGGTDVKRIYGEGIHIIAPWNEFYVYNVRLRQITRTYETLSKDGLRLEVVASARFRPKGAPFPWVQSTPNALAQLHKSIGPDYVDTVVIPEIGSSLRRVFENSEIDQIYTDRGALEKEVVTIARTELNNRYVDLDGLLIETIRFPEGVRAAIEGKLMEEQANLRYDYILAKEQKEAERKRIEATGVRDFQHIISDGLTDQYLRWKSIEAMVQISKSDNSKLVIIGGKDGVPVIVNTGQETAPATASRALGTTSTAAPPLPTPQPPPPTLPPPLPPRP